MILELENQKEWPFWNTKNIFNKENKKCLIGLQMMKIVMLCWRFCWSETLEQENHRFCFDLQVCCFTFQFSWPFELIISIDWSYLICFCHFPFSFSNKKHVFSFFCVKISKMFVDDKRKSKNKKELEKEEIGDCKFPIDYLNWLELIFFFFWRQKWILISRFKASPNKL